MTAPKKIKQMEEKMPTKYYDLSDLVRADCHDCKGCSSCCRGMGDSVLLDPYDVFQLEKYGKLSMEVLLQQGVAALTVWEGMILPHLQMKAGQEACSFLNEEGKCSIHSYRPGICRLFPLGRNFENGKMNYFLLEDACENHSRSKIRVSKWLGIEPAVAYHDFVLAWHDFRREMVTLLETADEEQSKQMNLYLLRSFFLVPYDVESEFYPQFVQRMTRIRKALAGE